MTEPHMTYYGYPASREGEEIKAGQVCCVDTEGNMPYLLVALFGPSAYVRRVWGSIWDLELKNVGVHQLRPYMLNLPEDRSGEYTI